MKKSFSRKASLLLAFTLFCSSLVPTAVLAEEGATSEIQIETTASGSYAHYDLKEDATKGTALDSSVNSYADAQKGSVETSKSIEATEKENEFLINLKVTSTEDFQSLELSEDAAVVLVLDRSGSMQWDLESKGYCKHVDSNGNKCKNYGKYVGQDKCHWSHFWGNPSRFQMMSDSLIGTSTKKGFLDSFAEDSEGALRKVSVVTFGGEDQKTQPVTVLGWQDANTEAGMDTLKGEVSFENITSKIYSMTSQGHGLAQAAELLKADEVKDIPNRFVILLTDGRPEGSTNIANGSYAEEKAALVKDDCDTTLYSIGFGTSNFKMYREDDKPVNEWLAESVASPGCFIPADSGEELDLGLEKISKTISDVAKAWHVIDPMGENIIFGGFTTDTNAATVSSNTIDWDLNKEKATTENGKKAYNLQYKIRLDNTKDSFESAKSYLANGYTDLSYFFEEEVVEDGKVIISNTSAIRHLNFRVPAVEGYKGKLVFNKVSSETNEALTGAQFKLTHNSDCSVCDGKVKIADQTATTDGDGKVVINNIPSGHEYTLEETKAPEGYINGKSFDVKVAYGKVSLEGKEVSEETPGIVENEAIKPVSTVLKATKELEGRTLNAGDFTFVLKDVNGNVLDTKENAADGTITFEEQTYTAPGTYRYTISEVIADDRDMSVIYDETIYNATVVVDVNNENNPTEYVIESVTYDGNTSAPTFRNKLRPGTEVNLDGTKVTEGLELKDGAFTFELKDADGNVLQTKTNDADGNVSFDALKFDKVGTYNFTINEFIGDDEDIVYDYTVYNVEVEVYYPNNNHDKLQKNVIVTKGTDGTDGKFEFVNKSRTPATLDLTATKTMEGAELIDGAFTFKLEGTDVDGNPISQTKTNNGEGLVTFNTLYFDKSGTYAYTIYEAKGTNPDTIYDHTVYTVTVDVTAPAESESFEIDVTYSPEETIAFTNATREHVFVDLSALKTMDGQKADADAFTFQLKDANGDVVDTVKNIADGVINFKTLEFGEEGVYTFTISEVKGDNEQVVYDRTVYDVTITVTAPDGDGAYEANVVYSAEDVVFANETREPATVVLEALKILDEKLAEEGAFEFELLDENGEVVQTVANAADGVIAFEALSFDVSGTYVYQIVEKAGDNKWMDYDESVYTVTIEVTADTDSSEGFQALVTIDKDGEVIENTPEFVNKTIPKPVPTGDSNNTILWSTMMSLAGAIVILTFRRKRA